MARILLLEPDRLLAQTYVQALSAAGHQVVACASAQAAVMAADDARPDVVIVELQLIEHSGIEFLYEFRSYTDWRAVPIIVHTHVPPGEFSDNWELLRHELGVKQYLYKPHTSLAKLKKAVAALQPASV
ncbi:MAG TPA: response regulator [Candidatus Saccharimonadales bacterium]